MVRAVKIKIDPSYMKWLIGYIPTGRDTELMDKGMYFVCRYNSLTFSGRQSNPSIYALKYSQIDFRDIVGRLTSLEFDDGYIYVQPLPDKEECFKDPENLLTRPRIIKKKDNDEWKLHFLVTFDIRRIKTEGDKNASNELHTGTDTGNELLS